MSYLTSLIGIVARNPYCTKLMIQSFINSSQIQFLSIVFTILIDEKHFSTDAVEIRTSNSLRR
jgi:hypothetical protein